MADSDDPLKVLGVSSGSTLPEVRERYRILCLKYHPDKNPGSEGKFREIANAYAKIRSDPSVLKRRETGGPVSYLDSSVILTIKDFYYAAEKSIKLSRHSLCKTCDGTGAKGGRSSICPHCDGQGIIDSSVLSLLGRDSVCPVCKGCGIIGEPCASCRGEKRTLDHVVAKFRATLHVYYNKHVLLKGMGNARTDGTYEDLMIRAKIHQDPYVTIDGTYFVVCINITPIQRVSGDRGILELFGRRIPYTVNPGSTYTEVTDGIRPKFSRNLHIRFIEYIPGLTPDTKSLYEQIKEIERKSCKQIGQLSSLALMPDSPQQGEQNPS